MSMTELPDHVSLWAELANVDHELRHVDVAGVRTRVLRAGSGPDLILLHGTGGHLEAYTRDIAGLAEDFTVTAYDMVGHGWSDLPDKPYTIDVDRSGPPVRRVPWRLGDRMDGRAPPRAGRPAGA
jgi:2-hydroxy-6-oxonona-2,4-dienedioate hydrolase